MRLRLVMVFATLLLMGCTASETVLPSADVAEATTNVPAAGSVGSVNRIAIGTNGGEIYLVNPDGSGRVSLAGGERPNGLQPVWSPDAQRIAWSEVAASSNAIVTAEPDGAERQRARTLFSGYFGFWDPTSTRIGFLGNADGGTGLVIDDGSGVDLDNVVDSDTFYYFSWNPDGTRWIVHSGSGLHTMDLAGTRTEIDLPDALFRAPVWTPDDDVIVAIANEGRNVIVRLDSDTFEFEELLEVGVIVNFVLDPTGRFLAVETVDEASEGLDLGSGATTVSQPAVAMAQPSTPSARVLVYDMRNGEVTQVHDGRVGSAWWSPNGESLALLVPENGAAPQFAQWVVWDRSGSFRTERFVPTRAYATTYAPFYDQFAQSVSPWSPDSTRFVYTGTDQEGVSGLFVQLAEPNTAPEWVLEDAAIAFWSPT